jgi:hypothetical protein
MGIDEPERVAGFALRRAISTFSGESYRAPPGQRQRNLPRVVGVMKKRMSKQSYAPGRPEKWRFNITEPILVRSQFDELVELYKSFIDQTPAFLYVLALPFIGSADGRVSHVGRDVEKIAEEMDAFTDVTINETNRRRGVR